MLLFDIGANIGRWAIANNTGNTIISIEASPYTFSKLVNNVSSYKNITPLHYAVSSSDKETVTFYHCTGADTISTLDKEWLSSEESRFGYFKNSIVEITVPVISIDTLIEKYGVPDLIKVDVEGAEDIVLQSISQKVDTLCFEWASEWKEKNIACINRLVDLGYTKFYLQHEDNYTFRPTSYDKSASEIITLLEKTTPKVEWGMIWAQ